MAMDSVVDAMRKPFLNLATVIQGSIVYLDAGASEVVQLSLGPAFLFGLGAVNVCDLQRSHQDDALLFQLACDGAYPASLVVLTTQLLPDVHQHMVRLLMVHHQAQRCTLFCAISELAHAQLDPSFSTLGVEAYNEYASALRQDLAAARAAAGLTALRENSLQLAVRHLPLHLAAIDSNTFVLPAAGAVASRAVAGGHAAGFAGTDSRSDHDHDDDAVGVSSGLSLLPHCLADISRLLGVRLDPYALGPVARAVAKDLAALPQGPQGGISGEPLGYPGGNEVASSGHHAFPRPTDTAGAVSASTVGTIGLVLIDRSLDLATPCMHDDNVLDAVFAQLPRAAAAVHAGFRQQVSQGSPHGRQKVALSLCHLECRPADTRIDVSQLAPLAPLTPPAMQVRPLPPPQPPQPQQLQQCLDTGSDLPDSCCAAPASATAAPLAPPLGLGIYHPADRRWLGWLQQLWPKRNKDALLLLRKWLKEALRSERISPSTRSRLSSVVTPAELAGLAACLTAQPDVFLRHQAIAGLALAAAEALATDEGFAGCPGPWTLWERCSAVERQLLLALPDGSQAEGMLKPILLEAINSAQQGRLLLDHVVQLLVVTYSLSGDRVPPAPPLYSADEADIKEALADVFLAAAQQHAPASGNDAAWHMECLPAVQQLLQEAVRAGRLLSDAAGVRATVLSQLHEVFQRLRWLAAARGKLRDVRRLMQVDVDTGAASSCTSLVRQVLTKILLQADNRDLQQPENASLVAGLLHKGLGRLGFGGISAPPRLRISDYSTVLIFVVGGISPAEVRELRQELEEHKYGHKPVVLFAGTTWLAAADAAMLVFG